MKCGLVERLINFNKKKRLNRVSGSIDDWVKEAEKLWLFNHKRADVWLPNFGFKRSLLSLLNS